MTRPDPEAPPDWAAAVDRIVAGRARRVLLLGPGDAGKSTLCRVLLRRAARSGRGVAVLDADPGQKLVGPPACATLGRGEAPALSALAFVGALDPLRGWRPLVAGTGRLAAEAEADLLVVNTSGLLAGAGRRLKAAKIAAARPDLLVALGKGADLEAVLADHEAIPALRLARSPLARRKGEGERRALRREAFRGYFAAAPVWTLDLRGLRLEGEPGGEPSPGPRRLVALADGTGRDLALGIALGGVEGPPGGGVSLRAPRPESPVAVLRWGALRLDEDGAERRPRDPARPRHQPSPSIATASEASSRGTKWPPGNSR